MALNDTSPNIQRSSGDRGHQGKNAATVLSSLPDPPSGVKTMLKTVTELGDRGQFAVRPSRLPLPVSRLQNYMPLVGSSDHPFASALHHQKSEHLPSRPRHHLRRPTASLPSFSNIELVQSISRFDRRTSGQRKIRSRAHAYQRTGKLSNTSLKPRSPSSLVNLADSTDIHEVQSDQPTTKSERTTGYRATGELRSPPDFWSHRLTREPSSYSTGCSCTPTSTPASLNPDRLPVLRNGQNPNHSFTFSDRNRSDAQSLRNRMLVNRQSYCKAVTPKPTPSRKPNSVSAAGEASSTPLSRSPAGSTTPNYYDYSESFVKQQVSSNPVDESAESPDCFSAQTPKSNTFTWGPRQAQTPFGTMPGSKFYPVELPTKHNRRPSEQSRRSGKGRIQTQMADIGNTKLPNYVTMYAPQEDDFHARRISTTSRRTCGSSTSSIFFPNICRSPRDLAGLAARVHSRYDEPNPQPSICTGSETPINQEDISRESTINSFDHQPWFGHMQVISDQESLVLLACASGLYQDQRAVEPMMLSNSAGFQTTRPTSSRSDRKVKESGTRDRNTTVARRLMTETDAKDVEFLMNTRKFASLTQPNKETIHQPLETPTRANAACKYLKPELKFITDVEVKRASGHEKPTQSPNRSPTECVGFRPNLPRPKDAILLPGSESSGADATTKASDVTKINFNPNTSRPKTSKSLHNATFSAKDYRGSNQHRLTASMDARIPTLVSERPRSFSSRLNTVVRKDERSTSSWQTTRSTSLRDSTASLTGPSIPSGHLADIDSDDGRESLAAKAHVDSYEAHHPSSPSLRMSKSFLHEEQFRNANHPKSDISLRTLSQQRRRTRHKLKLEAQSRGTRSNPKFLRVHGSSSSLRSETTDSAVIKDIPVEDMNRPPNLLKDDRVSRSSEDMSLPLDQTPSFTVAGQSRDKEKSIPEPIKRNTESVQESYIPSLDFSLEIPRFQKPVNDSHPNYRPSQPSIFAPSVGLDPKPALTRFEVIPKFCSATGHLTGEEKLRQVQISRAGDSPEPRQSSTLRRKLHLQSSGNALVGFDTGNQYRIRNESNCSLPQVRRKYDLRDSSHGETVAVSALAYRRRKMFGRFKNWWDSQCMTRFSMRRMKADKRIPGGLLV